MLERQVLGRVPSAGAALRPVAKQTAMAAGYVELQAYAQHRLETALRGVGFQAIGDEPAVQLVQ